MIRIGAKTRLNPEVVVRQAAKFFGPGGHGLKVASESPGYVCFEGGGGGVEVIASGEAKGASVELVSRELVSREWDYQAREFLSNIS
ncbi:MAG: hypothetical protein PVJ08_07305 [Dehalococcoidia bacterium]|jgi:hypothetical protein